MKNSAIQFDYDGLLRARSTSRNICRKAENVSVQLSAISARVSSIDQNKWPIGVEQAVLKHHRELFESHYNTYRKNLWQNDQGDVPDFDYLEGQIQCELIALRILRMFQSAPPSLEHINYIANYSTGGQVLSIRSSPAKSTKSIKLPEILYPTSNEVRQNINQLLCTQWNPRLPSLLSEIDRYLCFMALHPYPDANKRVARLNLQLFLMRHKVIDCPIFPIGPSMHCRLPEFTALFRSWLITYEQSEILDFMLDISMDVIDSVNAVLFV